MANWAQLDENNIVTSVIVWDNNDPNGDDGEAMINEIFGGRWVQTSYNGNIRGQFASVGFKYHEDLDIFTPPKPADSWIQAEDGINWIPPVPKPNDGEFYIWNMDEEIWMKPAGPVPLHVLHGTIPEPAAE